MNVDRELLTEKEWKLIKYLRRLKFGRVLVIVENGQPGRLKEMERDVKL